VPGQRGLFGQGVGIDAAIIVPHDRLLTKLAGSGVDSRVVVWVREFLVGRTQRVRVGGQLSKQVIVNSGVPQRIFLGPLLFIVYVHDIWWNIESSITLFTDDCIICRKITNKRHKSCIRM